RGPHIWQVCQPKGIWAKGKPLGGGRARPTAMLRPLNGPKLLPDGQLDWSGAVHMSDGPIYLDALATLILGRVVGVLEEPAYDPEVGAGKPRGDVITLPHVRPEDEMKWRYLAFLMAERDALAEELGARSRLGIYTVEDLQVNRFFS